MPQQEQTAPVMQQTLIEKEPVESDKDNVLKNAVTPSKDVSETNTKEDPSKIEADNKTTPAKTAEKKNISDQNSEEIADKQDMQKNPAQEKIQEKAKIKETEAVQKPIPPPTKGENNKKSTDVVAPEVNAKKSKTPDTKKQIGKEADNATGKNLPEVQKIPAQTEVPEKTDLQKPEISNEQDDKLAFIKSKPDPLLIGSSIAIIFAYLEYLNAKEASEKMKSEESKMNSASAYSDARYHQGRAEGYSEQVDYHYQNFVIGTTIAVGLFAWKIWKSDSGFKLPFFSVYPVESNHMKYNLSLAYTF